MLNFYFLKSLQQIIINNNDAKYIVCLPSAIMCNLSNTVVFISSLLHIFFLFKEVLLLVTWDQQMSFSERLKSLCCTHRTHQDRVVVAV